MSYQARDALVHHLVALRAAAVGAAAAGGEGSLELDGPGPAEPGSDGQDDEGGVGRGGRAGGMLVSDGAFRCLCDVVMVFGSKAWQVGSGVPGVGLTGACEMCTGAAAGAAPVCALRRVRLQPAGCERAALTRLS